MRGRGTWAAAATSAALLGLVGCAAPRTAEAPGTNAVHVVQVSQRSIGKLAQVRVARVGRVQTGSTEWTVGGVDPASTTITMEWVDGPDPECGEVDRVEVAERPDAVTIGLSDTARDVDTTCAAVGVPRRFDLHLRSPLSGRALLEPVTGVHDGLPRFRSGMPPVPSCSTDATPADAPIGMRDAADRVAPSTATRAAICRTAWPHGSARTTEAQVSDPAEVRQLVDVLNGAARPRPVESASAGCPTRSPGSWYAVYLTGPHTQVEVFVDEIHCRTLTNGSLRAGATAAISRTLAGFFRP